MGNSYAAAVSSVLGRVRDISGAKDGESLTQVVTELKRKADKYDAETRNFAEAKQEPLRTGRCAP